MADAADLTFEVIEKDFAKHSGLNVQQWQTYLQIMAIDDRIEAFYRGPAAHRTIRELDELKRQKETWQREYVELENSRLIWLTNQAGDYPSAKFYVFRPNLEPSFDYTIDWLIDKKVLMNRVLFPAEMRSRWFHSLSMDNSHVLDPHNLETYRWQDHLPRPEEHDPIPEPEYAGVQPMRRMRTPERARPPQRYKPNVLHATAAIGFNLGRISCRRYSYLR